MERKRDPAIGRKIWQRTIGFLAAIVVLASTNGALAIELKDLTGCWVMEKPAPTSLESDSRRPDGNKVIFEKMLLIFSRLEKTEYLVFGRFYEWDHDRKPTYVLGPTYQNGAFDPVAKTLTFGFPGGGLDRTRLLPNGTLLYIHMKASDKSAMSVRRLVRITCARARAIEQRLLRQQRALGPKQSK